MIPIVLSSPSISPPPSPSGAPLSIGGISLPISGVGAAAFISGAGAGFCGGKEDASPIGAGLAVSTDGALFFGIFKTLLSSTSLFFYLPLTWLRHS